MCDGRTRGISSCPDLVFIKYIRTRSIDESQINQYNGIIQGDRKKMFQKKAFHVIKCSFVKKACKSVEPN